MTPTRFSRLRQLASFLLLASVVLPVAAQNRLAIITELSGTVELARSGSNNFGAAEWGSPLFEGDRVRTASGSQAVLMFSNNNLMTVSAGNTYIVGQQAGGGRAVSSAVMSSDTDLTLNRAGQGEIEVLGGLRANGDRQAVALLQPIKTRVLASGPVFSWSTLDDFEVYRISVRAASGEIWSAETTETEIAWPADGPVLTPGETYFWKVEAEAILDVVESELASFRVMDSDTEASLRAGLSELESLSDTDREGASYQFLLGNLYARHGAYAQAIDAFEAIAAAHPNAANVHNVLASLYAETGNAAKAIQARERAQALNNKQ